MSTSMMSPNRVIDHHEGKITLERDAMITSYNIHQSFMNRQKQREQLISETDCFGMKSLKSDNIYSIIAHDFISSPEKGGQKIRGYSNSIKARSTQLDSSLEKFTDANASGVRNLSVRNKIFRNFHTKASELRQKKILKE